MKQKIFDFSILSKNTLDDFYVSNSNKEAYNFVFDNNNQFKYSIIYGPNKSGKTHLGNIWLKKNNALLLKNINTLNDLNFNQNIFIDNFTENLNEENLFYIINHCNNNSLRILLSTNLYLYEYNFLLNDLLSRLKTFNFFEIKLPDDDLLINIILKLLNDRQIIVNNVELIPFILKRINRTYKSIHDLIDKIDKLTLEKKRELTIPLIKELL